jgi:hypothetical protein
MSDLRNCKLGERSLFNWLLLLVVPVRYFLCKLLVDFLSFVESVLPSWSPIMKPNCSRKMCQNESQYLLKKISTRFFPPAHFALKLFEMTSRVSRVRIPPGCKVFFKNLCIAVLLSKLNIHCHRVYLRKK